MNRHNTLGFVLLAVGACCAGGPARATEAAMTLDDILVPGAEPQVAGTGYIFSEGPSADAQGNVYFSDGRNDSIHYYAWGKPVERFVADSTDANGTMFNRSGELCVCEGAAGRVVAFDVKTKQKRVLCEQLDGLRFNEPNDLAVDRQDGFYFSDPNYQHRGQPTVRKEDVYYCSAEGKVTRVSTVCQKPNGILLSEDGRTLYVADNRGQCVYRYDVTGPGRLAGERLWIAELGAGPDGMTLDRHGNLYVCCNAGGVRIFDAAGRSIGKLDLRASNACFGGPDFKSLCLTCRDALVVVPTRVEGIRPLPAGAK